MSAPIISVENLGKSYTISHQAERQRYVALRDVVADKIRSMFRAPRSKLQASSETFWALKDVSFEVKQGEVVGIIGRNGAGKSTLLKILSRITEPTEGRVKLRGRIASLLEVGTGFHPELTGRENIYLNGAILGMSRAEIRKKFDEIVAFAEVEKFLDTPVKRYSSGMYVRLAFAVAAHLEPEILIVDEVLAVGDAEFQKKCLGKMQDVATKEGRTVLFVSHNMAAVQQLCSRCAVFRDGRIVASGPPKPTIAEYLRARTNPMSREFGPVPFTGPIASQCSLTGASVNGEQLFGDAIEIPDSSLLSISIEYRLDSPRPVVCGLSLFRDGVRLFTVHDIAENAEPASNALRSTFELTPNLLRQGEYQVAFGGFEKGFPDRWFWNDSIFDLVVSGNHYTMDRLAHGSINIAAKTRRVEI